MIDYCHEKIKNQPEKWIFFLVPTVVLCKQQHLYLQTHGNYSVGIFHGELNVDIWNRDKWKTEYSKHRIFVMTAQILLDNLRHAILSFDQIELLVFDECHHAKKNHAYNRIMVEFYTKSPGKPKILGLTASPVSTGIKKSDSNHKQAKLLQELACNLNSKIITPSATLLRNALGSHPKEIIEYYLSDSSCYNNPLQAIINNSPQLFCNKMFFSQESHRSVISSLGTWAAAHLSQQLINDLHRLPFASYCSDFQEHIDYLSYYRDSWASLIHHRSPTNAHDISNQAIRLIEILTNHIQSLQGGRVCIIIFVQTRYTACYLSKLLQSLSAAPFHESVQSCPHCVEKAQVLDHGKRVFLMNQINTDYLVSKNGASRGYQMKNNTIILDKFRQGVTHILVATSVAEEGLDVQPCQLVVRFQEVQTVSSYVQSRGRARHLSAKYIALESVDLTSAKFRTVQACERLMRDQLVEPITPKQLPACPGHDEVYIVPSTGARVSLNSSISLIYQYCDTLAKDQYSSISPRYVIVVEDEESSSYQYDLYFPSQCNLQMIRGRQLSGKLLAKQVVSLIACKSLHEAGLLDDNLCPVRIGNIPFKLNQQPKVVDHNSILELHTVDLLLTNSTWLDVLRKGGRLLHVYTLSNMNGSLPFVLMTGMRLSKFEIKVGTSEAQVECISVEYAESKQYSYEELQLLQRNFGQLLAENISNLRPHLLRESAYPSPILISRSCDHFAFPCSYLFGLVQAVERVMTLFLCQETLKIQLQDIKLLDEALTAPSTQEPYDYNRLETLGDSILKFLISLWLFEEFPSFSEGQLSNHRKNLVSNSNFQVRGLHYQIQYFLKIRAIKTKEYIPPGYLPERRAQQLDDELSIIRSSNKMIADAVESIIGAIYIDNNRYFCPYYTHNW